MGFVYPRLRTRDHPKWSPSPSPPLWSLGKGIVVMSQTAFCHRDSSLSIHVTCQSKETVMAVSELLLVGITKKRTVSIL
jgi:hypothetical protein